MLLFCDTSSNPSRIGGGQTTFYKDYLSRVIRHPIKLQHSVTSWYCSMAPRPSRGWELHLSRLRCLVSIEFEEFHGFDVVLREDIIVTPAMKSNESKPLLPISSQFRENISFLEHQSCNPRFSRAQCCVNSKSLMY
jgi:hypothetical protein